MSIRAFENDMVGRPKGIVASVSELCMFHRPMFIDFDGGVRHIVHFPNFLGVV